MKIGGGNYEQDDVEQARKAAEQVIFQKKAEGELLNLGKMPEEAKLISVASPAPARTKVELVGSGTSQILPSLTCEPATHKWSEPIEAADQTSVTCHKCNLALSTEKKGSPEEVMADLLRQIPH